MTIMHHGRILLYCRLTLDNSVEMSTYYNKYKDNIAKQLTSHNFTTRRDMGLYRQHSSTVLIRR